MNSSAIDKLPDSSDVLDEYSPEGPLDWLANELAKWEVKKVRKKVDRRVNEEFSRHMALREQTKVFSTKDDFANCSTLRKRYELELGE